MSYLLDKKEKRKKIVITLSVVLVLLLLFEWRSAIWDGLSRSASAVFRPALSLGASISGEMSRWGVFLSTKSSLSAENDRLREELNAARASMENYNSLLAENNQLKEILGRTGQNRKRNLVLASILAGGDRSLYNTLLIDIGTAQGAKTGDMVFAYGSIPVGKIAEANGSSSKVVLFTSPGEKTLAFVRTGAAPIASAVRQLAKATADGASSTQSKDSSASAVSTGVQSSGTALSSGFGSGSPVPAGKNLQVELIGRGGGDFEMDVPRGVPIEIGAEAVLPGLTPYTLGKVAAVISDPRDAIQKFLLTAAVNVRELKFLEVEIKG